MSTGLRLLLLACLLTADARAQDIDYTTTDDSLKTVLNTLSAKGNFSISYNHEMVAFSHVRFHITHGTVFDALNMLRSEFPLQFKIDSTMPLSIGVYRYPNSLLIGRVLDHDQKGVPNLTIRVPGKAIVTKTSDKGYFTIIGDTRYDTLFITGVNIQTKYAYPEGRLRMVIVVDERIDNLPLFVKVARPFNDGYHSFKQPRTTPVASYSLDDDAINRIPSFDITDALTGQVSGLLTGTGSGNDRRISAHGTSTLFARRDPLLIFGQFPLDADPRVINRFDLQNIDMLKDAAAAVPWGARSANGVLVFTPRTGEITGKKTHVTFELNTSFVPRPDPHYSAGLDPTAYSGLEQRLFQLGFYDARLNDPGHPAVPPITETLDRQRRGLINPAQADALIRSDQQHSVADDLAHSFYQSALRQQLHIGLSKGDSSWQHYFSIGLDKDMTSLVRNGKDRMTLYDSYDQHIGAVLLTTRFQFARIHTSDNNTGQSPVSYTYADLSHPVNFAFTSGFTDTIGQGRLRPWTYTPTQELALADNTTTTWYGSFQAGLHWDISNRFSAEAIGRYMYQPVTVRLHYSQDGFYLRDLSNRTADLSKQENLSSIPPGDLLIDSTVATHAHYLRGNFTYSTPAVTSSGRSFRAQLGIERSEVVLHTSHQTIYAFDPRQPDPAAFVPSSGYSDLITGDTRQLPYDQSAHYLYIRYLALFGDIRYSWNEKFAFSLAGKWDGTNIVGVNTNHRFAPFAAFGVSFDPLRRKADTAGRITPFQLHASFGSNGNVGNRIANLVTLPLDLNPYGAPQSGILNPPDPDLSWEKVYTASLGIDFNFLRSRTIPEGRIQGSLDLYHKLARQLLGSDSLQLSAGISSSFGNNAALRGQGFDFVLNTENILRPVHWTSRFLLSYFRDWITRYALTPATVSGYVTGSIPRKGYPATALFTYRDAPLDPVDGSPRGYLADTITRQYQAIIDGKDYSSIRYSGATQPALFGSLLNTFSYDKWTFSFLLTFKAFYSFLRPSINYYGFVNLQDPGNNDYRNAWKKPGDEKYTTVPAPPASSLNYASSLFHAYSSSLATPGDHVRLQDIRLSYDIFRPGGRNTTIRLLTLYWYIHQPCLLWKANRYHLDPEAYSTGAVKSATGFTLGLHMEL